MQHYIKYGLGSRPTPTTLINFESLIQSIYNDLYTVYGFVVENQDDKRVLTVFRLHDIDLIQDFRVE